MAVRRAPGVFTLSIDVELAWGEFYRGPVGNERLLEARRIFPQLLRLLDQYQIPTTFAVVGHLCLDGCDGHPAMPRPRLSWRSQDWYDHDPQTDEATDPLWYAPSLVAQLKDADQGHDVGSHGFSHIPLNDPGVDRELAAAEMAEGGRTVRRAGLAGVSFVFPRNGIQYQDVLAEQRFQCYRGAERRWYQATPRIVRRAGHLLDQGLAISPPVGHPERRGDVVEVPSSMLFLSCEGVRRYLPLSLRIERARRGLAHAIASGSVFHLWLHAEDLVPRADLMLAALGAVLRRVRACADRDEVVIRTMADLAASA